jgi:O-antigen/teichoic acid export membrane protein
VFRGTILSWLQHGVAVVITIVLTPIVLRHLGPAAYGLWLAISQLVAYAGALDLGVTPSVVRFVSDARGSGDWRRIRETVGAALWFHMGMGAVCVPLGLLVGEGVQRWLDLGDTPPGEVRWTIVVVVLAAAVSFPGMALTGALRGFQRFDVAAGVATFSHLVRGTTVVAAVALGMHLIGLAAGHLLASLVTLGANFLLLKRLTGLGFETVQQRSHRALRELLSFGAYSALGVLGLQLAYGSDTILIGATLNATDAARFGVAVSLLALASASVGAFTGNLMPLAGLYAARHQEPANARVYLLGTRIAATLALPQLVVLFHEGPDLLRLWLGSEVGLPAAANLRLLVPAYLPSLLNAAALPIALGLGLQHRAARLLVGEGVAKVVLALALAPALGAAGVALATLVSGGVFQGVLWPVSLRRRLGIPLGRYMLEAILPPTLPALTLFLALTAWPTPGSVGQLLWRWSAIAGVLLLYWSLTLWVLRRPSKA